MKKLGKEINLYNFNGFRGEYGTINYKEPKAIYLNLYSWITPHSKLNWEGLRRNIEHQIKKVSNYCNEDTNFIKNRRIIDVDLHTARMEKNKSSFMAINVTYFTKDYGIKFPDDHYCNTITKIYEQAIFSLTQINDIEYSTTKA